MAEPEFLLHVCCAPCAAPCVERLQEQGRTPLLFFSNSNILSADEFAKRLREVERLALATHTELMVDPYDHEPWLSRVRGMEEAPERGPRCRECFRWALERTARQAGTLPFATTLTVSPHKRSGEIFAAGTDLPGFEAINFKKRDGFRRGLELSRRYAFYRQTFCGCEFSCGGTATT